MSLKEQVSEVMDQIRPLLQRDGGDVELIEVTDDGIVKVTLTGACGSCQYSKMTLKHGIEARLKELIPAVREVVSL